ncbi:hypothetical protein KAU33_04505 [Candidatus Dependentiae bacterium]|nr:hypothetical protein [Candidatus Dependentiae bacterium]
MTRKKALGLIRVELVRGKDIRPKIEEHFNELMYVVSDDLYQEKKSVFEITIFDNDTVDLSDGIYYIVEPWSSVFLSGAEFNAFHEKYGNKPTKAQKKNLRMPIVLVKFNVSNGNIFIGEAEDNKEKVEISSEMLIQQRIS